MNRVIRKKNENYTIISNTVLRDKRITLKSKGLIALVMSLPSNWDFTIRGLITIVKEGRDAIYASIKELKQYGYCDVVVCRDERGKLIGNDYVFYEEPHFANDNDSPYTENTDMDSPCTEKPYTDNPDTENPPQINKEDNKVNNNISSSLKNYDGYDWNIIDDDMKPIVEDWLRYKREKKQTYKPTGFKTFCRQLIKLSDGKPELAREIIERSMANNWAGIFELNIRSKGSITMIPQQSFDNSISKYDNAFEGWIK